MSKDESFDCAMAQGDLVTDIEYLESQYLVAFAEYARIIDMVNVSDDKKRGIVWHCIELSRLKKVNALEDENHNMQSSVYDSQVPMKYPEVEILQIGHVKLKLPYLPLKLFLGSFSTQWGNYLSKNTFECGYSWVKYYCCS